MWNLRRLSFAFVVFAAAACGGSLNPEAGFPLPVDPGTVLVHVGDTSGAPLPNVPVEIGNIPNAVGSFYSTGQNTRSDGTATFSAIPAGERTVSVTPPTGFAAGPDGRVRTVTVIKGQTVTVTFQLVKT